eukprot:1852-Heterococcus_DN1.PRE.1
MYSVNSKCTAAASFAAALLLLLLIVLLLPPAALLLLLQVSNSSISSEQSWFTVLCATERVYSGLLLTLTCMTASTISKRAGAAQYIDLCEWTTKGTYSKPALT